MRDLGHGNCLQLLKDLSKDVPPNLVSPVSEPDNGPSESVNERSASNSPRHGFPPRKETRLA